MSLPDPAHLVGFYQTLFAFLVMAAAGRGVLNGRDGAGIQIIAGWAAFCLVLTVWGMLSPASLRLPAVFFILAALGGLLVRRKVPWRGDLGELGRMLAIALPLLLIMADIEPSQSDALAVMMPNSAYIFDYGHFPTQDGPPIFTDVPVAPYNTELVSLLGTLAGGGFTANAPSLFTILLHLVAGLLLARVAAGERRPGWAEIALGLALATILNPGFVPRVSLSGYGESPLAIGLLFAGWLALDMMAEAAEGRRRPRLLPLALALVAMVNVKQQGIGLFAAFVGGGLATAALDPRLGWRTGTRLVLAAALPAAALYLAWRGYVLTAFPAGELKPLPFSQWGWTELPAILRDIGKVTMRKPAVFIAVAAVVALLARPPRWLGETARRGLLLTAVTVLLYNGFLLLTFVGHFKAEHSFHRYNTHLSLLVVLALVLAGRDALAAHPAVLRRWGRLAGGAVIAMMLAAPVAAWPLLRFDRDMPQPLLRDLARNLAGELRPDDRIALILPGDNTSVADALSSLLRFHTPRRPRLEIEAFAAADPATFAKAVQRGHRLALLSCTDAAPGLKPDLPANAAALLSWTGDSWTVTRVWPYPPIPRKTGWNWVGFIAGEPFCLKQG